MALMTGPTGKTYGLEHIKELTEIATGNIKKDQPGLLESGQCVLVVGDGRKGLDIGRPIQFDAIHVGKCYWGLKHFTLSIGKSLGHGR